MTQLDYPKTILQLRKRFPDESSCREYLVSLRWPEGFHCPKCQSPDHWRTARFLFHCRACDYQASVMAGTLFMDTHLPLQAWFEAIWQVTSQKYGASALGLQRSLGFGSYRTAWNLLHKLRRAMVRPTRDQLSGVVEVDEIFIGGHSPRSAGRGMADKALVVVAVEDKGGNRIGRLRLLRVADRSTASLTTGVSQLVAPGSHIRTDDWAGYCRLSQMNYQHTALESTARGPKNLLPLANRVASLLKRWLLGTHQGSVARTHLDYYLDEYTFRFNRRTSKSRGLLFYRLVAQAVAMDPKPAKALRGGRGELEPPILQPVGGT